MNSELEAIIHQQEDLFNPQQALELNSFLTIEELYRKACNHPSWRAYLPMQIQRTLFEEMEKYDNSDHTYQDIQKFLFTIKEKIEGILDSLKEEEW